MAPYQRSQHVTCMLHYMLPTDMFQVGSRNRPESMTLFQMMCVSLVLIGLRELTKTMLKEVLSKNLVLPKDNAVKNVRLGRLLHTLLIVK